MATEIGDERARGAGASEPWGHRTLADGDEVRLPIGPLTLSFRRRGGELWLSSGRAGPEGPRAAGLPSIAVPPASGTPGDETWTRWATESFEILLAPVLADRPVVVAPEVPFRLAPGARARIYVRIPLWARVALRDRPEVALCEVPSIVMSDTWWGDFASGELAYWLPTKARREITDSLFEPHLVMCPLELVNRSGEVLAVEKLAVRVIHMSVFRDGSRLWANETRVEYESEADGSHLELDDEPPSEAPRAVLLTPARERPARRFRARTFGKLIGL